MNGSKSAGFRFPGQSKSEALEKAIESAIELLRNNNGLNKLEKIELITKLDKFLVGVRSKITDFENVTDEYGILDKDKLAARNV